LHSKQPVYDSNFVAWEDLVLYFFGFGQTCWADPVTLLEHHAGLFRDVLISDLVTDLLGKITALHTMSLLGDLNMFPTGGHHLRFSLSVGLV